MNPETPASDAFIFVCPARLDCVLATAEVSELEELRAWCDQLTPDSYGQVFIEAETAAQIEPVATPWGVAVNWLLRDAQHDQAPGVALAAATEAWFTEWVRVDYGAERNVRIWSGARAIPAMQELWSHLETEFSAA